MILARLILDEILFAVMSLLAAYGFIYAWLFLRHAMPCRRDGHRYRHRRADQDRRAEWHEGRGDTRLNWLDELVRQQLEVLKPSKTLRK